MRTVVPGMNLPPTITGHTRVFALVGHPVRHSLSPQMHSKLLEQCGLDGIYVAFDVNPEDADRVAEAIRVLGLSGVNLTVPFKERILPFLDEMTLAAREAGAVNVVTNVDGVLTGYNTDGEGFLASMREEHHFQPEGKRCLVLGAGGAARAITASLAAANAKEVVMLNRTLPRAEVAVASLSKFNPNCQLRAGALSPAVFEAFAPNIDLVVNCLGGGAEASVEALSIEAIAPRAIWADINYWMESPPQLENCKSRGLPVSTGLGMLIHQGALSFELFTGHPIDVASLHRIVKAVRKASDPIPQELG